MESLTYQDVLLYHEATKHHLHRYAKSLGYMDWANQPNPFRFYTGPKPVALPLLENDPPAGYADLYLRSGHPPKPFSVAHLAGFLELSLGLSAWKGAGDHRWSLRINPSSGNLHPTEAHLILPETEEWGAGVFHYNALTHSLEPRASIPPPLWDAVTHHFQTEGFLVALTSIFWRESWKYGERAFRYCHHDVGHAMAALSLSANLQGWKIKYLNAPSHEQAATLLGFGQTAWPPSEREHVDLICFVYQNHIADVPRHLPAEIAAAFGGLVFQGRPNQLSPSHVAWPVIDQIAVATQKPQTRAQTFDYGCGDRIGQSHGTLSAAEIIRRRRSAVAFKIGDSLPRDRFLAMLAETLPRRGSAPFDLELAEPRVDLLLFVHQVEGLASGIYFYLRRGRSGEGLKHLCRSEFLWEPVASGVPLYLLQTGDFRRVAQKVSCHQEIAGEGVFALSMIAKFQETIQENPHRYRELFWETGLIGQLLYLEAEAHGLRGTGIGCFFDDAVHDLLGLTTHAHQSLYHFTVGDPVEDHRLRTYPAYDHLERE